MLEGDFISVDGTAAEIYAGAVKTAPSEVVQVLVEKELDPKQSQIYQEFVALMSWADKVRRLNGLPATIRLLDPPLHEFLPHTDAQHKDLANELGVSPEKISQRVHDLHEFNPMLGHRGCRLGISADKIAEDAQFFSFGTNGLTQTTLGMSRDDSGSFLPHYQELEIMKTNPFATIDQCELQPFSRAHCAFGCSPSRPSEVKRFKSPA